MMTFIKIKFTIIFLLFFNIKVFPQDFDESPQEIRFERGIERTGDILQIALPATGALLTIIHKDWDGAKQHSFAFATNLLATHGFKKLIRKRRPEGSHARDAFPSGHTSAAFQGASFIQRRYGWKYGGAAYLLAGFVAYSRVEGLNDKHDTWDVIGGAILGTLSTYVFTKPYEDRSFDFSFSKNDNTYMAGIIINF